MSFDFEEMFRSFSNPASSAVNHGDELESIRKTRASELQSVKAALLEFDTIDSLATHIANLEKYAKEGSVEYNLKNLIAETRKLIFERGLPATIEAYKAELEKRRAKIINAYKECPSV